MTEQRHIHEYYSRTARFLGATVADIKRYQRIVQHVGPRTLFRSMEMSHALWNVGLNQLRRTRQLLPTELQNYGAEVWLYLKQRPPDTSTYPNDAVELAALHNAIHEAFTTAASSAPEQR